MSVVKTTFAKAAQTPASLLTKLKAANLVVSNDAEAIRYLTYVGHFRLKGYWFHLSTQRPSCSRSMSRLMLSGTVTNSVRDRALAFLLASGITVAVFWLLAFWGYGLEKDWPLALILLFSGYLFLRLVFVTRTMSHMRTAQRSSDETFPSIVPGETTTDETSPAR